MSIIHVTQIRSQVEKVFGPLIDIADAATGSAEHKANVLLTRGLAAYAIQYLGDVSAADAARGVVDGGDDNGIDALFYDEHTKKLFLVQSKWIHDGSGEPASADVKKFVSGVRDFFNLKLERFNDQVRAHTASIQRALGDPDTTYEIVLAHTGANNLSVHSSRDLSDLAEELNDTSEVVHVSVLNQGALHKSLTAAVAGEPIDLIVGLKSWGKKDGPHLAFYGQLSGPQVAEWWSKYRTRLFASNLRSVLGDTDVNAEMRSTADVAPKDFWYFNNGVTMLARRAQRSMAGGADNDFAQFHCSDVSIVNGAQTVGTLGKLGETDPEKLRDVMVPLRIIERADDAVLAESVTRANNRQNRIDGRDFAALDPEQSRIRTDLLLDNIQYQVMRTESFARTGSSFDFVEATTALACASGKPRLATQAKREIGKLWEDTSRAPYKELFNPSVAGRYVWRCVQIQRRIDAALDSYGSRHLRQASHFGIRTHGNRLISALVFAALPSVPLTAAQGEIDAFASEATITVLVDAATVALAVVVNADYPNAMIPTLFKNIKKCEGLFAKVSPKMSQQSATS